MKHNPEDHLRLVGKIAARYAKGNRMEFEDIFQEGCIGLVKACKKYKEGDVPFGAFAAMNIEFEILRALEKNNILKTEREVILVANRIRKMELQEKTAQEVSDILNCKLRDAKYGLRHINTDVMSLNYEISWRNGQGEKITLLDVLRYEKDLCDEVFIDNFIDKLEVKEVTKKVLKLMAKGMNLNDACQQLGEEPKNISARIRRYRKNNIHKINTLFE